MIFRIRAHPKIYDLKLRKYIYIYIYVLIIKASGPF